MRGIICYPFQVTWAQSCDLTASETEVALQTLTDAGEKEELYIPPYQVPYYPQEPYEM